jgi:type VI secretion system protein ImpH
LEVSDEAFLCYGGLFGHRPPTAVSLVGMLEDFLGLPTRVLQFQGQWLYLSKPNQSSFPSAQQPDRRNNQLGQNLVIGRRVWDIQNKFRVRIGPLTYSQFRRFMPDGDQLVRLCQLVRSYVGPGYDFDILPVLKRSEVPRCCLGDESHRPPRLGWNTWLRSASLAHDAIDAVFVHEGTPSR